MRRLALTLLALCASCGAAVSAPDAAVPQPLCPVGHAGLRRALYMPTLAATKYNPWLRRFYERLRAAGKPAKVAIIASMRKLLHAVYSVAKNRRPFTPILPSNAEVAT